MVSYDMHYLGQLFDGDLTMIGDHTSENKKLKNDCNNNNRISHI
jgi:hypothetical protein